MIGTKSGSILEFCVFERNNHLDVVSTPGLVDCKSPTWVHVTTSNYWAEPPFLSLIGKL